MQQNFFLYFSLEISVLGYSELKKVVFREFMYVGMSVASSTEPILTKFKIYTKYVCILGQHMVHEVVLKKF